MPKADVTIRCDDRELQNLLVVLRAAGTAGRQVLRAALLEATAPVEKHMQHNLFPGNGVLSGMLRKSIGRKAVTLTRKNMVIVRIGARRKTSKKGGHFSYRRWLGRGYIRAAFLGKLSKYAQHNTPTRIAHLVEFGTKPHEQPNNPVFRAPNRHPGARAMPFIRPAWSYCRSAVPARATLMIKKRIPELMKKLASKGRARRVA